MSEIPYSNGLLFFTDSHYPRAKKKLSATIEIETLYHGTTIRLFFWGISHLSLGYPHVCQTTKMGLNRLYPNYNSWYRNRICFSTCNVYISTFFYCPSCLLFFSTTNKYCKLPFLPFKRVHQLPFHSLDSLSLHCMNERMSLIQFLSNAIAHAWCYCNTSLFYKLYIVQQQFMRRTCIDVNIVVNDEDDKIRCDVSLCCVLCWFGRHIASHYASCMFRELFEEICVSKVYVEYVL